jgi:hypothetical protein
MVPLAAVLAPPAPAAAWGLRTHRWVAERAAAIVGARCPALGPAAALADRAVEPDTVLKARLGREERIRHFLDLDEYGTPPFRRLPRDYDAAVARFGRTTVEDRGILPWYIGTLAGRLRAELRRGDVRRARVTAGYLAHYAADATMPLHATGNHDGQRTRQRGLHARIERHLVDRNLRRFTTRAQQFTRRTPIPPAAATAATFATLLRSFDLVAPVLAADRTARHDTSVGSSLYYRRLDVDLRDALGARIGRAASFTAALWEGACAP